MHSHIQRQQQLLDPTALLGMDHRRFVNLDNLVCPGCGDPVVCEPPGYWQVADGLPVPGLSHPDATALCRDTRGAVAGPMEVTR